MRIFYGFIASVTLFISCQTKEESTAQKAVDRYIVFVDSVNETKFDKRKERWDFIEREYIRKRNDAETALNIFKGKAKEREQKRVAESDKIYEGVRVSVER